MRQLHTLAAALAIASFGVMGASAQGRGNAAPKAPKAPSTVSRGNAGGGGGSHAPKAGGTQATATTSAGSGSAGKSGGKGHTKSGTTATSATASGSNANAGTTTTTATTVAPPNALSMKLSRNPQQLARLSGMLPQGMTIEQATTGFRNQGQFVAALNASRNQGVSFVDLQQAMTVDGMSLGQAVKQLRNAPPAPDAPAIGTGTGTTPPATGDTTTGGSTTGGSTTGAAGATTPTRSTATASASRKAS